jgi:hypothetical protein
MNDGRWLRLADRIFRCLLYVYPKPFRDQYADDMARVFRLRW